MSVIFERLFFFYMSGVVAAAFLWISQYFLNKAVWNDAVEHMVKISTAKDKGEVYSAILVSILFSWILILAFIYVRMISP